MATLFWIAKFEDGIAGIATHQTGEPQASEGPTCSERETRSKQRHEKTAAAGKGVAALRRVSNEAMDRPA